jgi:hypothetical protein
MRKKTRIRWYWALLTAAIVGGVLAGGVVGASFKSTPEGLESAIATDPVIKVAELAAAPGLAERGVYLQQAAGHVCLWDAPTAAAATKGQGGCNRAEDPFGGGKLMVGFAYDGGPAIRDVRDARLVGMAALDADSIQVLMSDGSLRDVKTRRTPKLAGTAQGFRAFGYRLKNADIKQGIGPVAVVALDAAGNELDRQPTGYAE